MTSPRRSILLIQNAILIFMAALIASVIFLVDLNTDRTVAISAMYSVVILYSWLLPGKYASIYTAVICSVLAIVSVVHNEEISSNVSNLSGLNMVISLVVIWTCVALVFIAKSSFESLENTNKQLSESSAALFKKVKELDAKQDELSLNKIQLEKLNSGLQIKNRELERFTSIASHDLQEPLRTIGNMIQLIGRKYSGNFDEQGLKVLDYVTSATNRMNILIKGLLEFSRIGNKRELQKVDCNEVVSTIILDLDAAINASYGKLIIAELPVLVGNPVELRLLFQNLISNGLKFRKAETSPVIEVSSIESKTHFEFCIKDNGIGIESKDFEKIFYIFQRLHHSEQFEGTGLGLAYCRKIVELHGGRIWIDSIKDVGSSFYFTLAKMS